MTFAGSFSGKLLGAILLMCTIALAQTDVPAKTKTSAKKHSSTAATSHAATPHSSARKSKKSGKTARGWRHRGQQKIDAERTRQIQEALIREHYLSGEPTGKWNDATQDALRRYQAANGWQNKTVPDSRALIKLGLGPSHDHLLNPESAMTSVPQVVNSNATQPADPGKNPHQ